MPKVLSETKKITFYFSADFTDGELHDMINEVINNKSDLFSRCLIYKIIQPKKKQKG